MAVIQLKAFGGEMPSTSARALPPSAAKTASNILATSSEFRPLLNDMTVTTVAAGKNSLYRLARTGTGAYNTNVADSATWVTNPLYVSYVKGQIDDDATERTYYSFDDPFAGTAPRAFNAAGNDRQLGVPVPTKPAVVEHTPTWAERFTREDGDRWVAATLVPDLVTAARAAMYKNDFLSRAKADQAPVAGPLTSQGFTQSTTDPWNYEYTITWAAAEAAGLNDIRLYWQHVSTNYKIQIDCLPYWPIIGTTTTPDDTNYRAALALLNNPRDGSDLMSSALISSMGSTLVSMFSPADAYIKPMRDRLEAILKEFKAAVDFAITVPTAPGAATAEPAGPQYTSTWDDGTGVSTQVEDPDWVTWRATRLAEIQAEKDYAKDVQAQKEKQASRIDTLVALGAEANKLRLQIEARWVWLNAGLTSMFTDFCNERNFDFNQDASATNLVVIDPDRVIDTRFYVITYVNDWGDESAPSPVSDKLEIDQYTAVTITKPSIPSGRNLVGWRLYRSNVGSAGTSFQLIADADSLLAHLSGSPTYFDYFELVTAETGYWDAMKSSQLQEVLPSLTWAEPPALTHLTGMANGVMAGAFDNTICFCEPYKPYAWPVEYQLTTRFPIVGMAAFGQSLFVGTRGTPYLVTGVDSASMALQEMAANQACLSARSLVATDNGVLYASPDGICMADYNGVKVVTQALFTREDWKALKPEAIMAAWHDGCYYFFYDPAWTSGPLAAAQCYALDFAAQKLTKVSFSGSIAALHSDKLTDTLYALSGTSIIALFGNTTRRTGVYRTGKLTFQKHAPLAWLQVFGDYSASTTVRWYGDGALVHTATIPAQLNYANFASFPAVGIAGNIYYDQALTKYYRWNGASYVLSPSGEAPVRLPSGRFLEHEVEIETTSRITSLVMAGSTEELQAL